MLLTMLAWPRNPDMDQIACLLSDQQYLFPHRSIRDVSRLAAARYGLSEQTARCAWVAVADDGQVAIGRLTRAKIHELADRLSSSLRSLHTARLGGTVAGTRAA